MKSSCCNIRSSVLNDLSMSRKLMIAPAVVIFFLIVFACSSYLGLSKQKGALNDLYQVRFKTYENTSKIINQVTVANKNIYKMLGFAQVGTDANRIQDMGKGILADFQETRTFVGNIAGAAHLNKEERELYATTLSQMEEYDKLMKNVMIISSADVSMGITMMTPLEAKFQSLNKTLQDLWQLENRLSKEGYDSSLKTFTRVITAFAAVALVAVVVSVVISMFMSRLITLPINKGVELARKMSAGDLTMDIEVGGKDELGQLLSAMHEMSMKLRQMIGNIKSMSQNVASGSEQLSATAGQILRGMTDQTNRASQIATSAEELSQTIVDIAKNASNISISAKETLDKARNGESIVNRSVNEVKEIAFTVNESAGVIKTLGERSKQIGEIINVINDIADQTNLLALNAAIEAARAGEQGRGFAVVADEVRRLAERTAKATSEINDMIKAIQKDVHDAVTSMSNATEKVEVGVELSGQAVDTLETIVKSADVLQALVQQIASATEEMSTASEQISSDIDGVASTSKEISMGSDQIAEASNGLANVSSSLQNLMTQFTV